MAMILPFRGIGYNGQKTPDFSQVVAPPYDVISPAQQEVLYRRHPQNVIRLILNKETAQDNPKDNRYTRSAGHFRDWLRQEVLIRAGRPMLYFLKEAFDSPGQGSSDAEGYERKGFIGLVRLEEYAAGVVLPHEKTQTKPRADRLALMESCQANFSQIFSLYADEERAMDPVYEEVFSSRGPDVDVTNDDGIRHRLWTVDDPGIHARVTEIMRSKKIFIADGHHRYETALAYRKKQCALFPENTGKETYHFTMMYLAAMEDKGLLVLPTHRVVTNLEDFQASDFMERLRADFSIEGFPFHGADEGDVRQRFLKELASRSEKGQSVGMLLKGSSRYQILSLKEEKIWEKVAPGPSPTLKALDVNLLHIFIFQNLLKIRAEDLAASKSVLYFKEPPEAAEAVRSGSGLMAFFLNSTKVYQVRDVSLAGETMPSKSTFFYPKLLSGLVINPLDPHEEISVD